MTEESNFRPQIVDEQTGQPMQRPDAEGGERVSTGEIMSLDAFLESKGKTRAGLTFDEAILLGQEFRERPEVRAFEKRTGLQISFPFASVFSEPSEKFPGWKEPSEPFISLDAFLGNKGKNRTELTGDEARSLLNEFRKQPGVNAFEEKYGVRVSFPSSQGTEFPQEK